MNKKLKNGLVVALVSLVLTSCTGAGVDTSLKEAQGLIDREKYVEAIKIYESLLEKYKEDQDIYIALSRAYGLMGDGDKELEVIEGALERLDEASLYLEYAKLLREREKFSDAEAILLKLLDRKDQAAYREVASLYDEFEKYDELIQLYEKYNKEFRSYEVEALVGQYLKRDSEAFKIFLQDLIIDNKTDSRIVGLAIGGYIDLDSMEGLELVLEKLKETDKKELVDLLEYFLGEYTMDRVQSFSVRDLDGNGLEEFIFVYDERLDYEGELGLEIIHKSDEGVLSKGKSLREVGESYGLEFRDLRGDGTELIEVGIHSGGSAGYLDFKVVEFKGEEILEIEVETGEEYDIRYLDGFKILVSSEKYNKNYTMDISDENKEILVEESSDHIYSSDGQLLKDGSRLGLSKAYLDGEKVKGKERLIMRNSLIEGDLSHLYLGSLEEVYELKDQKLVLVDIRLKDSEGRPVDFGEYKDIKPDKKDYDLDRGIVEIESILAMDKSEVLEKYGDYEFEDIYQVAFINYEDMDIYFNYYELPIPDNSKVSSIQIHENSRIFGGRLLPGRENLESLFGKSLELVDDDYDDGSDYYAEYRGISFYIYEVDSGYEILCKKSN